MDKNTQLALGIAALAAAGYLVWKETQKNKVSVGADPNVMKQSFAGTEMNTVVGDRKKMAGFVKANKDVTDSGWVRADGNSIAPTFFDIQSSSWVR